MTNIKKCYVGMSGGVDSSVAAYLLKEKGYEVHGIYANCFYDNEACRNSQDHADAVKVAGQLGIGLETKDYRKIYRDNVLKYFYSEYEKGRTPNADILCNSEVKFGIMAQDVFDSSPGACLATGHYVGNAKLSRKNFISLFGAGTGVKDSLNSTVGLLYGSSGSTLNFLMSGADSMKDQSYFLYRLYAKTANLGRFVFPLSEMTKKEVRRIGRIALLSTAAKPDSQGICFVGNVKIRDFINRHIKTHPGSVVDLDGKVIGSHHGMQYYTVGQRHGFNVKHYSGRPLYVVGKIPNKNLLIVGSRSDAQCRGFTISDFVFPYNIGNFLEKFNDLGLTVRVRSLGKKIPCIVSRTADNKSFEVELLSPEFGVSPGQSAVFYIDRLMLGGGVINTADHPKTKK